MGITSQQAMEYCGSDDLIALGMEADAVRRRLHPESAVTYTLACPLNLDDSNLHQNIEEASAMGATSICLQTSAGSAPPLSSLEQTLASLHAHYSSLVFHGLSATAVVALGAQAGISVNEILRRLQAAGLSSLAGEDAGILDDVVQTRGERCSVADWLTVHRAAHVLGMPTTASLCFGGDESMAQRVTHLEMLSQLQQETRGFAAFLPFVQAAPTQRALDEATAVEYLRMLALSRLMLEEIPHIQVDWASQGLKLAQVGLRFGADDLGTALPAANPELVTEQDLRRVIRGAGLLPVERDSTFRINMLQ